MKRFRDMDQPSGGEKHSQHWLFFSLSTGAREALGAIVSGSNIPAAIILAFFVLDEVDAALGNTNTSKTANHIRKHASDTFQSTAISHKGSLHEKATIVWGYIARSRFQLESQLDS